MVNPFKSDICDTCGAAAFRGACFACTFPSTSATGFGIAVVVGACFRNFAAGDPNVVDIDQLRAAPPNFSFDKLHLGQGLSTEDVYWILKTFPGAVSIAEPASRESVHKRLDQNVLVSVPRRIDDEQFELELRIDPGSAEISDHVTGIHVSMNTLSEAARQSTHVVTNLYFLPDGGVGFDRSVQSASIEFGRRHVFPLPTTMRYRVMERDVSIRRQKLQVEVAFWQNGMRVAVARLAFKVFPPEFLRTKEIEQAKEAVMTLIGAQA